MIDYLNIYNKLNKLAELRSKVNIECSTTIYGGIVLAIVISMAIITIMIRAEKEIKDIINITIMCITTKTQNTNNDDLPVKLTRRVHKIAAVIETIVCIIAIAIAVKLCVINPINTKNELKTADDSKMLNIAVDEKTISESTANEMYTSTEIADLLRVNGVSDIELFKQNIEYLKETYDKKVKTFKLLYNKDTDVDESDYINAILNQFYLGKIDTEPADITGFEEDYPRISTGLKK
jgi:hypothetical protein